MPPGSAGVSPRPAPLLTASTSSRGPKTRGDGRDRALPCTARNLGLWRLCRSGWGVSRSLCRCRLGGLLAGWEQGSDLNRRPPRYERGDLTGLSYPAAEAIALRYEAAQGLHVGLGGQVRAFRGLRAHTCPLPGTAPRSGLFLRFKEPSHKAAQVCRCAGCCAWRLQRSRRLMRARRWRWGWDSNPRKALILRCFSRALH